jgi:hypothetical protein
MWDLCGQSSTRTGFIKVLRISHVSIILAVSHTLTFIYHLYLKIVATDSVIK